LHAGLQSGVALSHLAPLLDDVEVRNFLVITSDRSRLIVQLVDRRFEPIPKIVGRLDIAVRRPDAVVFDAIDRGIDGVLR
jgi:hypothetical protein